MGLTLIEILVGVVILSFGMVVALQAMAKISEVSLTTENRFYAYNVLASKIADLEIGIRERRKIEKNSEGMSVVNGKPFYWELAINPLTEGGSLELATLIVRWKQGKDTFVNSVDTLVKFPEVEK